MIINPDDVHNTYLLIPDWVVNGTIVESTSSKTPTFGAIFKQAKG